MDLDHGVVGDAAVFCHQLCPAGRRLPRDRAPHALSGAARALCGFCEKGGKVPWQGCGSIPRWQSRGGAQSWRQGGQGGQRRRRPRQGRRRRLPRRDPRRGRPSRPVQRIQRHGKRRRAAHVALCRAPRNSAPTYRASLEQRLVLPRGKASPGLEVTAAAVTPAVQRRPCRRRCRDQAQVVSE